MNHTFRIPILLPLVAALVIIPPTSYGDEPLRGPIPPGVIISPDEPHIAAIKAYLLGVEAIEKQATEAKIAARDRLIGRLGKKEASPLPDPDGGLIGTVVIEGKQTGTAFHYAHARLFDPELIWSRVHKVDNDGKRQMPSFVLNMVGYVDVPHDMTVKVWQSAGGVNLDHGEIFVGDLRLGIVGDDRNKQAIYVVDFPAGKHPVRWVLTGGTFQNSLLKFENPENGELLKVFHTPEQRRETKASEATELVEADADPTEWLKSIRNWPSTTIEKNGS